MGNCGWAGVCAPNRNADDGEQNDEGWSACALAAARQA